MIWNLLDTRSIWLKEFAVALGEQEVTQNWHPEYRLNAAWSNWERVQPHSDPKLSMHHFPLQRGYSNSVLSKLTRWDKSVAQRIRARTPSPADDVLVCTAPYYAPVAEQWEGPVVYYLTDLTKFYDRANASKVQSLDRRMCRVARVVCPNSMAIGDYLVAEAGCDLEKITVVPNATRRENILPAAKLTPDSLPSDLADLPRPVIGVIGNFADNMDWELLRDAIRHTHGASWALIGPTGMKMRDRRHGQIRAELLRHGGRVRFIGSRNYGDLQKYARSFDVAFIPYKNAQPTISGSATRFYEHLAACRPIIASHAHLELRTKKPLVSLIGTGQQFAWEVERLSLTNFQDGLETLRWQVSQGETWNDRASAVVGALGLHRPAAADTAALTDHEVAASKSGETR